MDKGAWWATIRRVTESYITEVLAHICIYHPNAFVLLLHIESSETAFALEDCTSPGDS